MKRDDFVALEDAEYTASIDLYRAAPPAIRAEFAVDVGDVGPATCITCRGLEPAVMFRRALRLGVRHPASEAELDAVVAFMNKREGCYAVPVAPQSEPPSLASWLETRGFTQGYAWMKFSRPCEPVPQVECDLEIRVVGAESAGAFGRVVTEGFGLPPAIAPWIAALPGRDDWICVLAFAGDTPVASGAVHLDGDRAWLGFGATLPSHRRHGAQNALIARRLGEASQRGARIAVTETGERVPDKPSGSYRNILRAGFAEAYLRQNYMSPST